MELLWHRNRKKQIVSVCRKREIMNSKKKKCCLFFVIFTFFSFTFSYFSDFSHFLAFRSRSLAANLRLNRCSDCVKEYQNKLSMKWLNMSPLIKKKKETVKLGCRHVCQHTHSISLRDFCFFAEWVPVIKVFYSRLLTEIETLTSFCSVFFCGSNKVPNILLSP